MSDLVRHSVTQPSTGVIRYVPSILVGDRPVVEAPPAQSITGALFATTPTFFAGVATATYTISGALFTKAPTFFGGQLNLNITGGLFIKAPTFFTGEITQAGGVQNITGALFVKAGTFHAGEVSIAAGPDTATLRVLVSAQRW